MRICYLATSVIVSDSANSVHVMRMCQALALNGNDITLVAHQGTGDDDSAFAYYGIDQRFRLARLKASDHRLVRAGQVMAGLMPSLHLGGLATILQARLALAPMIRRDRPDLLYARNFHWLAGLPDEVPFVVESHVRPSGAEQLWLEKRIYARRGFRRLVVISEKLRAAYEAVFPWIADKIIVAHDAADDPSPEMRPKPPNPGFHVGYVGHLYEGRGGELMKDVAAALPEMTLHVVGGTAADRERLASLGLPPNMVLHTHQPHARLGDFFPMFDVVLAPYQRQVAVSGGSGDIASVMSPMKLFEYMSWGKAIVCSDLPVLREIVADGDTGVLLPPDDPRAWVAALKRLAANPGERARLGAAARARFLARHTWRQRAKIVLDGLPA